MLLIFGIITSTLPNHANFNDESKGLWRRPQKNMCRFLSCSGMSEQKISSFFHFHYTVFGRSIVVTRILKYAQPKNNMSSQILKRSHFNGKIVLRTCDLSGNILVSSEVTSEVIQETPMRDLMLDLPWKEYPSPKRKPKDLKKTSLDWT